MNNLYIQEIFMIINSQYFNYLIIFTLCIYISFIQNKMVSNNTIYKNLFFKIFSLLIIIFISDKNKILGLLLSILYILNIVTLNTEGLDLINDYEKFTVDENINDKQKKKKINANINPEENIVKEIFKTCSVIEESCKNNNKKICKILNKDIANIFTITKEMKKKVDKEYIKRDKSFKEFNYSDISPTSFEDALKL
jgi:hypothetical protein